MKIESDIFEFEAKGDFTFYVNEFAENNENRSLYFSRANHFHYSESAILLGSIECVGGSHEEGIFERIHEAKRIEAEEFAGYIEEPEEEFPLEFSTILSGESSLEVHHHLVRETGLGYVVLVTLLSGFMDPDIADIRDLLADMRCKSLPTPPNFAELMPIDLHFTEDHSRVGKRMLLNSPEISHQ